MLGEKKSYSKEGSGLGGGRRSIPEKETTMR